MSDYSIKPQLCNKKINIIFLLQNNGISSVGRLKHTPHFPIFAEADFCGKKGDLDVTYISLS
jgi:hypothetical protein